MHSRVQYYQLVASLPALPRPRDAERLPINPARLEERLRMLRPEDAEIVNRLRHFIHWQNRTPNQSDADVAAAYQALLAENPHPAVRSGIEFRANLRTVFAALRRRLRGESEPPQDQHWGVGRWVRHIENNWTHPDFKLAQVFPWIPDARQHLEDGEALQLEELAMNLVWNDLDRVAFGKYFELETIIAFIFKWDILRRWLSYKREAALEQFLALAEDIAPAPEPDHASPAAAPSS